MDWDLEYYSYDAKWFDLDKSIPTILEYRVLDSKRFLLNIDIDITKAGYSKEDIIQILNKKYGEDKHMQEDNSTIYIWVDSLHSKQFILTEKNERWVVEVSSAYFGSGDEIKKYDLTKGIQQYKDVDKLHYKLLYLIYCSTGTSTYFFF